VQKLLKLIPVLQIHRRLLVLVESRGKSPPPLLPICYLLLIFSSKQEVCSLSEFKGRRNSKYTLHTRKWFFSSKALTLHIQPYMQIFHMFWSIFSSNLFFERNWTDKYYAILYLLLYFWWTINYLPVTFQNLYLRRVWNKKWLSPYYIKTLCLFP